MVIRKQHIISWLLEENYVFNPNNITIPQTSNMQHLGYLSNGIGWLVEIVKKQA